jgi:hypothetical protein
LPCWFPAPLVIKSNLGALQTVLYIPDRSNIKATTHPSSGKNKKQKTFILTCPDSYTVLPRLTFAMLVSSTTCSTIMEHCDFFPDKILKKSKHNNPDNAKPTNKKQINNIKKVEQRILNSN